MALAAEGPSGTGLIGSIGPANPADKSAFQTALGAGGYDLIVYAHQLGGSAEPFDSALSNVLCGSTKPAIITDTRFAASSSGAQSSLLLQFCSGAYPSLEGRNYDELGEGLGTLFDQPVELDNPGYPTFSYSVAAIPFDALAAGTEGLSIGATQLEGSHELAFSETNNSMPWFFGSVVSFSADRPFNYIEQEATQPGTRKLERWASEVHFSGFAPLKPVPHPAPQTGQGLTLAVKSERFVPPGGYDSATVWAEVTRPTVGLDVLLASSTCTGSTTPAGDSTPGNGKSVPAHRVPVATQVYSLNDGGLFGDAKAGDRVWSRHVPQLGQVTGTYEIRYFAELTYTDANGDSQTLHREELVSQYVGPEVLGGGANCGEAAPVGVTFVALGATGAGNGTSWENAYTSLQAGIDAAPPGTQVWVKQGTYYGGVLELKDQVQVYGGFAANLSGTNGSIATRNLEQNASVLDGGFLHAIAIMGDESHLDGFRLRNGSVLTGGVVVASGVRASIANCKFQNNSLLQAGSLLYAIDSTLSVSNSVFDGNSWFGSGGIVLNLNANATFTNCTFRDPLLTAQPVMKNYYSDVNVIHSTFAAGSLLNWVSNSIQNVESNVEVYNSILWRYTAPLVPQIVNLGFSTATVRYSDVRGGWSGTGNISGQPNFVNATLGDFRLQSNSPCIDAADSRVGPRTDIAGLPRVDIPTRPNTGAGSVPYADMGAHERQL